MKPHPDLWAIIPVKPFGRGKSRLHGVLDAGARTKLNRQLFDHVFGVALAAFGPTRVAVVTADDELSARVSERGAHAVVEHAAGGLNAALGQACRYAAARGASEVMVLPSDLPFVTAGDIDALTLALGFAPSCVIAPDASNQATNALALSPPDPDFFRFGSSSFAAHLQAARASGAAIEIVRRPGLAFDLDTPEDYLAFTRRTAPAT
jgi:2-phospho-L-lactate/phosphoenolpyruvate guanylyltransferase